MAQIDKFINFVSRLIYFSVSPISNRIGATHIHTVDMFIICHKTIRVCIKVQTYVDIYVSVLCTSVVKKVFG